MRGYTTTAKADSCLSGKILKATLKNRHRYKKCIISYFYCQQYFKIV